MVDLVTIARQRVDPGGATSHWEGCERDHRECLIQRLADELERLQKRLETRPGGHYDGIDTRDESIRQPQGLVDEQRRTTAGVRQSIEGLRHDTEGRTVEMDDAFTRWVRSLPSKHWARYDLSAAALGWNAAIESMAGTVGDPTSG